MTYELDIHAIEPTTWDAVLELCRRLDVEEGETAEYMYSVRTKTLTLTIWTQPGWKNGWYQLKVSPKKKRGKFVLVADLGAPPAGKAWTRSYIEEHVTDLLSRVASRE